MSTTIDAKSHTTPFVHIDNESLGGHVVDVCLVSGTWPGGTDGRSFAGRCCGGCRSIGGPWSGSSGGRLCRSEGGR